MNQITILYSSFLECELLIACKCEFLISGELLVVKGYLLGVYSPMKLLWPWHFSPGTEKDMSGQYYENGELAAN